MSKETNNEPNKPIEARDLTEKELAGVVGGKECPVPDPGRETIEVKISWAGQGWSK